MSECTTSCVQGYIAIADTKELDVIINTVKARRNMLAEIHKAQFSVGMSVEFEDRKGNLIRGSVIAINRKNLKVRSESGTNWTVYPCFVKAVES